MPGLAGKAGPGRDREAAIRIRILGNVMRSRRVEGKDQKTRAEWETQAQAISRGVVHTAPSRRARPCQGRGLLPMPLWISLETLDEVCAKPSKVTLRKVPGTEYLGQGGKRATLP